MEVCISTSGASSPHHLPLLLQKFSEGTYYAYNLILSFFSCFNLRNRGSQVLQGVCAVQLTNLNTSAKHERQPSKASLDSFFLFFPS